jgi:hypothetical protein
VLYAFDKALTFGAAANISSARFRGQEDLPRPLLFSGVVFSLLSHAVLSVILTEERPLQFQLRQDKSTLPSLPQSSLTSFSLLYSSPKFP